MNARLTPSPPPLTNRRQDKTTLSILEKLHGLLGIDRNDAEPHSVEARRRLAFFTNSLFMDMPRAPPVQDMMSWSCMTPFYSEDVVYSRDDLEQKNEDGLTTLMYLQVRALARCAHKKETLPALSRFLVDGVLKACIIFRAQPL